MPKFCGRAGAVIPAIVLSLSLISVAAAQPSNAAPARSHKAILHAVKPYSSTPSVAPHPNARVVAPTFPTWPEGSPEYHGSNGS